MKRIADTVERTPMLTAYRQNQIAYLVGSTGCSQEAAAAYVESQMSKIVNPKITYVDNPRDGVAVVTEGTLGGYLNRYSKSIITPSGTVYKPAHEEEAFLCTMTREGLGERKTLKKKQFAAEEAGDKPMVRKYKYAQTTVKVRLNSLPGGYGSAYNIFYDKPGYNSITSCARAMIAYSYTTAENLLGGNFAWFSRAEAINWVVLCTRLGPSKERIEATMARYNMKEVSALDVFQFMGKTVLQYNRRDSLDPLNNLLQNTPKHTLQFLYYASNLRHIVWGNEGTFRSIIKDILTPVTEVDPTIDPASMNKFDGDLMPIVYTILGNVIGDIKLGDMVAHHPDVARICARTAKAMQKKMDNLEDLFETFVYHNIMTPNILTRRNTYRNTVIISDTDSVIFTSKDWANWHVGHLDNIDIDHYSIAALATYWLTKANDDAMAKFSIAHGATKENVTVMRMKNEYLYPALLLYDTKKTYAGLIKIQEGVNLPKPKPDIKGAMLRSSLIAEESVEFIEDMIINDIVIPATKGNISANYLIDKVIGYEQKIRESLARGEMTYLQKQSIKMMDEYANPEGSAWSYCEAWNAIFGEAYGVVNPPDKVPMIKLGTITVDYLEHLRTTSPQIHKNYIAYVGDKKQPTAIVLNSLNRTIPPELIPLINVRHIIFTNLKPAYLTLERLGVTVGHENKQLLMSDIYG